MPSVKRVLGRGLADLLPAGGDAADPLATLGPGQEVPIAALHPNPRQPRTRFDEGPLNELAESVRQNGILQPLLVRPRPAGGYEIVAGERRYRAALRVGLKQVPVVVRQLTDEETLALALIENLIRADIGPLETARAFQRLMEDFGWTQEEMGRRVGKSRSAVANSLRLLKLPDPIQRGLEQGEITEGHARTLLGEERQASDPAFRERQLSIFRQIRDKNLTVRDVERLMREEKATLNPDGATARRNAERLEPNMAALEDRLRTLLGTRVRLSGTEDKGKIEIEYFSAEELDGLLMRLEPRPDPRPTTPGPVSPFRNAKGSEGSPIKGLLGRR
ncbi:MAG: ParB/RepB/Spo0J family partition protein [Capsulimonadales bacterium]|nr:ParB/RepB/Spo0J family partition protein [Capsulimonadales bacterium]